MPQKTSPVNLSLPEEDISMSLLNRASSTVINSKGTMAYTALANKGQLILRINNEDGTHKDEILISEGCEADHFNILISDKGLNILATATNKKIYFVTIDTETHEAVESDLSGVHVWHILPIDWKTDEDGAKITRYIMVSDTTSDDNNLEVSSLMVSVNDGKVAMTENSNSFIITMSENSKVYTIMMVQFGDIQMPVILACLSDVSDSTKISNVMITIPNIESMEHNTIMIDGIKQFDEVREMFNMKDLNVIKVPIDIDEGAVKEEIDDTENQ